MKTFNPMSYAKLLVKEHPKAHDMVVQVADSDLCLVINVYEGSEEDVYAGEANLIGQFDTGLDGTVESPETELLAEKLVSALNLLGVRTTKYDWEAELD